MEQSLGLFLILLVLIIAAALLVCIETSVHDLQWSCFVPPPTVFETICSALSILLCASHRRFLQNSSANSNQGLFEGLPFWLLTSAIPS